MKSSKLIRSSFLITIAGILSKGLGCVREMLIAYFFGTGIIADSYRACYYAFMIPVQILAGTPLEDSVIPQLAYLDNNNYKRSSIILVKLIFIILIIFSFSLSFIFVFFPFFISMLVVPGFTGKEKELTELFIRIIGISAPFYIISSYQAVLLNSKYKFKFPAFRALYLNIFLIIGILIAKYSKVSLLIPLFFVLAYIFMFFLFKKIIINENIFTNKAKFSIKRAIIVGSHYIKKVIPLIILTVLWQLIFLSDRIVASYLDKGSIASMDYARFIIETPLITLGLGIMQVILPFFSDLSAKKEIKNIEKNIRFSLIVSLFIMLPISVLFFIFSKDILTIIYMRGKFDINSLKMTTFALKGFSIGMWATFSTMIIQKIFFARQKQNELKLAFILSFSLNIILNIILGFKYGVFGITLATSISWIILWIFFIVKIKKEFILFSVKDIIYCFFSSFLLFFICIKLYSIFNSYIYMILITILCIALWILLLCLNKNLRVDVKKCFNMIKNSLLKKI